MKRYWTRNAKHKADDTVVTTLHISVTRGDIKAINTYVNMGKPAYPYPRIFLQTINLLYAYVTECHGAETSTGEETNVDARPLNVASSGDGRRKL